MKTLALILVLGLAACGGNDDETDTDAGTELGTEADSDTSTDTEADSDSEADTDADTTNPTAACETCFQGAEQDISQCTSQCFSDFEQFCDREMCRMNCTITGRYGEQGCQDDAGAACDDAFELASCRADCLADWEVCTTGSVCPQGNSGNCHDTWNTCDAACWAAR